MSEPERPNPDALLAHVEQSATSNEPSTGRLKVFFGAAPGVGKTYAMLEEARKAASEGVDVVIGYAEPHIRSETESLLLGLELLPYKMVEYRGATLKEFDLAAAIARRPKLLCVASNSIDCRCPFDHPCLRDTVSATSIEADATCSFVCEISCLATRLACVSATEVIFQQENGVSTTSYGPKNLS